MPRYFSILLVCSFIFCNAQKDDAYYWQQHVDYAMEIDVDVDNYRYTGKQELSYKNNSPDTLKRVYYHLYFNAFQPGSEMDLRAQTTPDPDPRMVNELGTIDNPVYESRISKLQPNEVGYIKVNSLTQNSNTVEYRVVGTILEVVLAEPILPGSSSVFEMTFDAQIPVQIRRNGRNNSEGIELSMAQWYPKLAEYDKDGWHLDPYIQREFYGVWGNFDVKITIDKDYIIGGTGYLQNPNEIGYGYESEEVTRPKGEKLTWHFVAPKVHDFTWAADPDYIHDSVQIENGPVVHFFYQNKPAIINYWKDVQPKTVELFEYFINEIGPYPYDQYSVIQGGDGGMEYPMCTLISGEKGFGPLLSVIAHEVAHSWFHGVLANNESLYPWMDEGFAQYFDTKAENFVQKNPTKDQFKGAYDKYREVVVLGIENPMSTHADRHRFNASYSVASYYKGLLFLDQLEYIIGTENFKKTIKTYYKEWAFKHPRPQDFIRVAEKVSKLNLDWYLKDWTQTTSLIEYVVKSASQENQGTKVELERLGMMAMPLDIEVVFKNGKKQMYYVPLRMMRGKKPGEDRIDLDDWSWASPSYTFTIDANLSEISTITIDPKGMMADVNKENNVYNN